MLALGLTLLVAIEIGARLFGFGYSTRLFHERTVNDAPVLTVNHYFFRSFLPSSISRSPQSVLTAYRQSPKVRQILWLGESAALGLPLPHKKRLNIILKDHHGAVHEGTAPDSTTTLATCWA